MGDDKRGNLLMAKAAPVLVLSAGALWGLMGLFVRTFQEKGLHTMEIVSIRSIVTCLVLFIFLVIARRDLLKIRLKDLWCFIGTGLFSIVFFNYCYFKAITMTSLSVAAVLLYTAPVMVMILSYFLFHEKFTGRKIAAVVLTFSGCVLATGIVGSAAVLSLEGILAGLGAGFGYALYSIFGKFAIERGYHSLTISFYTFLMAAIGSLPLADGKLIGLCMEQERSLIGFVVVFGLVSTVIPYLTYTIGLQYMENSKASILASVEPVVATLLGVVCFRETMTWSGVLGVVLVLAAICICQQQDSEICEVA